jgi:hypothetical protein
VPLHGDQLVTINGLTMVVPPGKQGMARGSVRQSDVLRLLLNGKVAVKAIHDTGATVNILSSRDLRRLLDEKVVDIKRDMAPVRANVQDYNGKIQQLQTMVKLRVTCGPVKDKSVVFFNHEGAYKNLLGSPGLYALFGSGLPTGVVPLKVHPADETKFVVSDKLRLSSMAKLRLLKPGKLNQSMPNALGSLANAKKMMRLVETCKWARKKNVQMDEHIQIPACHDKATTDSVTCLEDLKHVCADQNVCEQTHLGVVRGVKNM